MASAEALLSPSERERILRAMVELCAERGYEETTVEAVTERAEVSDETFAELFSSKEACAANATSAILGEILTIVASSFSPDRSELDSATLGIKALLEFMAAKPSVAWFGFIVTRQMGPSTLYEIHRSSPHALAAMLDRGRTYSGFREQPESAARGALGGVEALVRGEIMAGRTEQLGDRLPAVIYGATVPFLGQAEALRLARRSRELADLGGGV